MSQPISPMRSTERFVTPMENIYPGLRIVEKFHPPSPKYADPSYEVIAGLKGGGFVKLDPKRSV